MKITETQNFWRYQAFVKSCISIVEKIQAVSFVLTGKYFSISFPLVSVFGTTDPSIEGQLTVEGFNESNVLYGWLLRITTTPGDEWQDSYGNSGTVWEYQYFHGVCQLTGIFNEWYIGE